MALDCKLINNSQTGEKSPFLIIARSLSTTLDPVMTQLVMSELVASD